VNSVDIPATTWRKSSRTNGNGACVEVATWRKSSRSGGSGNCVEVAALPDGAQVSIRDSKDPNGAALTVSPADWRQFMGRVKGGLALG
jgi:Domain of unknown function (DUF397)